MALGNKRCYYKIAWQRDKTIKGLGSEGDDKKDEEVTGQSALG